MPRAAPEGRSPLASNLCVLIGLLTISGAACGATVKDPGPALRKTALHDRSTADVAEVVQRLDDKLAAAWKENKLTPSDSATDHEFIRRASLDVIGRIPTPDEIEKYLRYPELTRRSQVIDDLLAGDEYAERWAGLWADWLLGRTGIFGRGRYHVLNH
jgi:hypothetical protein